MSNLSKQKDSLGPYQCNYPGCKRMADTYDQLADHYKQAHEVRAEPARPVSSNPMTPELSGLVLRLQEWSRNCLIDGFKMDKGEPTLQALLKEAAMVLMRSSNSSAPETSPQWTCSCGHVNTTPKLFTDRCSHCGEHRGSVVET